ncbi:MAG: RsmB/NOP family class I SAM-dependent RNA methyltransferase [candidate division WOR-3 bacterium]|jgi:NOL1/NOP2/sun family putative RNA methylase|nr:RsmB/NOP family class I SAM-dependent RNA methyltransferase [candidate division WOR-3 bacterium]MDH7518969.1 RsmB/NOP family class I SAM-dependent RNA methyltransferase [bacterium]
MRKIKSLFPEEFIDRYARFIPDFDSFLEAMVAPLPTVFRVNTLKTTPEKVLELLADFQPQPLAYYPLGFVARNGQGLGKTISHFLGLIYIQDAASMIPALVLDPKPRERVLDIAAAPGSKTTQMAAMMKNTGLIVANDISLDRVRGLIGNIDRMGCLNVAVCRTNGLTLAQKVTDFFDRVLVDAPCSSEGTMRKTREALRRWTVKAIQRFSTVQRGLIRAGYQALKPGGIMVYSTCTVAPEENEAVVTALLKRYPDAEIVPFELPGFLTRPALREWNGELFPEEVQRCRRILPQDNDTEAFFVALIRKPINGTD